jgi:hypothetical protein
MLDLVSCKGVSLTASTSFYEATIFEPFKIFWSVITKQKLILCFRTNAERKNTNTLCDSLDLITIPSNTRIVECDLNTTFATEMIFTCLGSFDILAHVQIIPKDVDQTFGQFYWLQYPITVIVK